ncbi:response regulator transcription factor [Flavobacteriales bacterium]|nr:response regulator transcription factor [Flavobacteriales bacterium]
MSRKSVQNKRAIIIDDHKLFASGLAGILENIGLKVIATFSNAIYALNYLKNQEADIIFSDINMPKMDGISFCNKVREKNIETPIIMLSMYEDPNIIKESFNNGANGYLSKNTDSKEIIKAISTCLKGATYFDKSLIQKERKIKTNDDISMKYKLTKREREVLIHILKDERNTLIASELAISRRTVETHRKNIFLKLGVKTNIGLAKIALNYNLF